MNCYLLKIDSYQVNYMDNIFELINDHFVC